MTQILIVLRPQLTLAEHNFQALLLISFLLCWILSHSAGGDISETDSDCDTAAV